MSLRKIAEPWGGICYHPEHNPPGMIVLEPGTYEHTCPGCGAKMVFTVPRVTCDSGVVWTGTPQRFCSVCQQYPCVCVTSVLP
jgi:hypothetical protein